MTSPSQPAPIPEFDVWLDQDGLLHGRHRSTGRNIAASSESGLRLAACAVRIVAAWHTAEDREARFITGDPR
jgi:hypothetical protein